MKLTKDKKILIVGLGLIGGSYAEGLTKAGYTVGAITKDQESIDFALQKGYIANGTTNVDEEYVKQFDIVIFALYPHVFIEWIEKYHSYLKRGAILTDVTGVKGSVIYQVQAIISSDLEFIGAHPMAGREVYGVKNANCNIFLGANYIVTPTSKNTTYAIELCEDIGRVLGFKHISTITPEQHDEMVGFLSQLTHCIAVTLMTCKESKHLVDYTGDSFRDLTRIARINEEMWTELFLLNKNELLDQMDLFLKQFIKLKDAIAMDDEKTIKEMMILSTERRGYFDDKK